MYAWRDPQLSSGSEGLNWIDITPIAGFDDNAALQTESRAWEVPGRCCYSL
jgi:hypothetical protein